MASDRLIVFDTETTALVSGQICQLSYLIIENGSVSGKNFFFTVDWMSEGSLKVHGMTLEMLAGLSHGERFSDRAQEIFSDFYHTRLLIGHNVAADNRYIRAEFARLAMDLPPIATFCTMNRFTRIVNLPRRQRNGRAKPPRLCELEAFYQLEASEVARMAAQWFGGGGAEHDARYDAAATWLCVLKALEKGDIQDIG